MTREVAIDSGDSETFGLAVACCWLLPSCCYDLPSARFSGRVINAAVSSLFINRGSGIVIPASAVSDDVASSAVVGGFPFPCGLFGMIVGPLVPRLYLTTSQGGGSASAPLAFLAACCSARGVFEACRLILAL